MIAFKKDLIFSDQKDAAKMLYEILPSSDIVTAKPLIIASSLEAVPIVDYIASRFSLNYEILFTEKIYSPINKECVVAMVSETKELIYIEELINSFGISLDYIYGEADRKYEEGVLKRIYKYRKGALLQSFKGRDILLIDEEKALSDKKDAEASKKDLTNEKVRVASDLNTAKNSIRKLAEIEADLKKIREKHEMIDPLAKTANGNMPGKDKITLEAYVQAFYFERIIRHANLRLRMMSEGQYEFVRSTEAGNKKSKFGLDLNVLDHYSGTERPVNTLSGGESFMASLSLALGLSDEVQASAGGIKLDTMFIDEGFGSLDSETLEKAMRTLTELADEDKLVGIISHVEALRTRIDKQIVVTKDRGNGSRVNLLT